MKKNLFILILLLWGIGVEAQAQKPIKKFAIYAVGTSSATGGASTNTWDGNLSTFWQTNLSATSATTVTVTLKEDTYVEVLRYYPRQDNDFEGSWGNVSIEIAGEVTGGNFKYQSIGSIDLMQSSSFTDILIAKKCKKIRFTINDGKNGFASAAELEPGVYDHEKIMADALETYFEDDLATILKPGVTSSEGVEDPNVKAVVDGLLNNPEEYKKFRVAEYEPYESPSTLQSELKIKAPYCLWENPSGIYLKSGETCYVLMTGADKDQVSLTIKNWVENENESNYSLRNGLNMITASNDGNVFVKYFTDNYKNAPNVKLHFINAPVRGYWDQQTMTDEDWKNMLSKLPNDNSIIIVRSEHAQLAYPVSAWKEHCPTNVDSLMTLYQQVQWACRDILGLNKYGRQKKNRQLYYATTYGFMAAGGHGAYCNVTSLGAIMTPDSKKFDLWGVGHEWGHNNQVNGFHWSGCGETTNNITASWAQLHFTGNRHSLRLEDEISGIDEYSGMRGGRMQAYFEEGLRKGVQWQLQDGPDYHGATPNEITVNGYDAQGNYIGNVTTTSRNYDHFIKLSPFWQLNLWGTLAGKCPDIIPMVIEEIRNTPNYQSIYNTNGKQQVNWMKIACDSAKIDLLPFFEKAGMLKPIHAYIEDYGAGWNIIDQNMIDELKAHVAKMQYPAFTEEINYINAHNFHIYRDNLKLDVPATLGSGCTYSAGKVKVNHNIVKNAVAFETYNANDELIRITMYGLGADDAHSYTYVLYPSSTEEENAAAYIMAVGFDGTRSKIYAKSNTVKSLGKKYYTITSAGKGGSLSHGSGTTIDLNGNISWDFKREEMGESVARRFIWMTDEKDGKTYLYNPQSHSYFSGTHESKTSSLSPKSSAIEWKAECIDEDANKYIFGNGSGQYINAYTNENTGLWSGGAADNNNVWIVKEVKTHDIEISSATGYLFACEPFALELTENLKAYVVSDIVTSAYGSKEYTYAVLEEIDGNVIPADMPVILVGKKGTYTLNLVPQDNTLYKTPNLLKGTSLKITPVTKNYVMNNVSKTTNAGVTAQLKGRTYEYVANNSSYLLSSEINNVSLIYLDAGGLVTDIENIEEVGVNTSETYYDLNGASTNRLQKGRIYVTSNGKLILTQ